MAPSELNAVARLVLIADRYGPEFLDNADNFDRVIGRALKAKLTNRLKHFPAVPPA